MKTILTKILNLPVIVQGALGSFRFWLVFTICSRTFGWLNSTLAKASSSASARNEHVKRLKSGAVEFKEPLKSYCRSVLHGMAASDALVAAIFVVFGLIASSRIESFGAFAYLIALFYLFRSLKTMQPPDSHIELSRKMLFREEASEAWVDGDVKRKQDEGSQESRTK
jgi:hypothetical protein